MNAIYNFNELKQNGCFLKISVIYLESSRLRAQKNNLKYVVDTLTSSMI